MNEIEEKFFKTFGINCIMQATNPPQYIYPPITDRILLELICILNKLTDFYAVEINYENLKEEILMSCIDWSVDAIRNKELKHQVQSLFTEGEE